MIAGFGFFDIIGRVSLLISDLEGDRQILHTLSLPISSTLVFVYIGVSWAITSSIIPVPSKPERSISTILISASAGSIS